MVTDIFMSVLRKVFVTKRVPDGQSNVRLVESEKYGKPLKTVNRNYFNSRKDWMFD
ncbi:hypothetical protein Pan54_30210 [Rubinisphaera italica]|uniref:Uncharacterized protein n=1 Tax=Rubinisphaera italica TaxID=2527969 RepID=A0A5C5XH21_9PLAN|nr:hypothetical protein Pan54_30210 [Rubinisphaera italica]